MQDGSTTSEHSQHGSINMLHLHLLLVIVDAAML
jgi:hypothetical protein